MASTLPSLGSTARPAERHFNFPREALRKFVSLSTLSLSISLTHTFSLSPYLVTRKFVEFSRDFSTSVSFFPQRFFLSFPFSLFPFFFFYADFRRYVKEAEHFQCSPATALLFDGKGRHSSRISSHLNGPGYKYATALGNFMRTAPAPRLFSTQFSRLIRSNFAVDLARHRI